MLLMARGSSNRQVASSLHLAAEATVKAIRLSVIRVAEVRSR